MQQLRLASVSGVSAERCAQELLASVPSLMRFIRHHMRGHRRPTLSVPQLRALVFVNLHDDASLSALAENLGLSRPATSRMVELLVQRGLLQRRARRGDRRFVSLSLTGRGQAAYTAAQQATQAAVARRFAAVSVEELTLVSRAMDILNRLFAAEECRPAASH